jgi:predicted alpha/beta superfamily hydrolase
MQAAEMIITLRTPVIDERPVILTGTFNDWKIDPEQFQLQHIGEGTYEIELPDSTLRNFPIEFKFVKESWDGEEVDEYGRTISNRRVEQPQPKLELEAPRWKQQGRPYPEDLLPKPHIISEDFEIPQLIRTRRISALLPHDYYETDKRYPVLYLQDGQNLFDKYAPFGNWAVDKRLAVLNERGHGDLIVVAIDHAESERIEEFTPSYRTRLGAGDGKKYVRFLADTLKPYIDKNFRTLSDRDHTGIGGSSMGGLISIYAGMMYPEVYGKLMIFSPSLWVAPNIHFHSIRFHDLIATRIYLYAGEQESKNMIPNVRRFKQALEKSGKDGSGIEFHLSIDPEGQHNEERWGKEFAPAVEWLFFNDEEI